TSSHSTGLIAVSDAVRLVLLHYIEEGDLARRRYRLTSKVAVLRDREIASVARYQRLFREFIAEWMGDPTESASLRAELMAASVVAAHNHVLRRWLRGETSDPVAEMDEAMREVLALFPAPSGAGDSRDGGTTVVAFRTGQDLDALLPSLRRLVEDGAGR
ncbi:TetR family transcriptional regulator, partial [Streptomyces sp. NPDC056728]